ncbi:hypothetical protein Dsin_004137 [Dipteronia sinensis]|uniref:DUF674 family protein n=1 Tax=Dipteronia sinensis TaxID=43782 RepID=A0AAE0B8W4_9ROSI|nr:hypothetical protein Dsin_004137 [Dipteronia sinensis]
MAASKVKLKHLIDTNNNEVLFAEAGKDFVDFLFYLLSLPISTVVRLLKKKGEVGCLSDLYDSLEKLNETYIQSTQNKSNLLYHKSSLCDSEYPLLLSGTADQHSTTTKKTANTTRNVYMCPTSYNSSYTRHVSDVPNYICPHCRVAMSYAIPLVNSTSSSAAANNTNTCSGNGSIGEGGFVKGVVTYMVMDNLEVKPMSTISSITLLNEFDVQNVRALKEKVVVLNVDEGLKLLKASLECKNALTSKKKFVFKKEKEKEVEDMAAPSKTSKVLLKLLIDTKGQRVLFAETSNDFVDFLFYILSLPVATVTKLLKKKGDVGCITDLYQSLENLNQTYMQPNQNKTSLLNPKSSLNANGLPLLLSDNQDQSTTTAQKFYQCGYSKHVSDVYNSACPCGNRMTTELTFVKSAAAAAKSSTATTVAVEEGFVKGVVTYMVMDNLEVKPMSTISSITLLNEFNVQNVGSLKEKIVVLGVDEVINIDYYFLFLMFELVLTILLLGGRLDMAASQVKLKLLIDSKSKKVLFAEAGKDFVDFLFYLLSLPVSTVVRLLKNEGEVGCLSDLYDSLENLNDTYIQPTQNKTNLLYHKSFLCGSEFPLLLSDNDQYSTRNVYMCPSSNNSYNTRHVSDVPNYMCPHCNETMNVKISLVNSSSSAPPTSSNTSTTSSGNSTGDGGFVKGVVTYMVMDNLEVMPMSTISSIALLNSFNVQNVCSLEEKVVALDVDEGLKLLKASLECKNVLTTVFLGNIVVEKEPEPQ